MKLSKLQSDAINGIAKHESVSLLCNSFHESTIKSLIKKGLATKNTDGTRLMLTEAGKKLSWNECETILPPIGKTVLCRVDWYRYGDLHHSEELEGKYLHFNRAIGHAIFDIGLDCDEAYANVTHWKELEVKTIAQ